MAFMGATLSGCDHAAEQLNVLKVQGHDGPGVSCMLSLYVCVLYKFTHPFTASCFIVFLSQKCTQVPESESCIRVEKCFHQAKIVSCC